MSLNSSLTLVLSFYYNPTIKKFTESPRSVRSRIRLSTELTDEQIEDITPVTYREIKVSDGLTLRVCDRVEFWAEGRRFSLVLPTSWLTVLIDPPVVGAEETEGKEV